MASGTEVARAYVTIIPTTKESGTTFDREVLSAASKAGDAGGRKLGSGLVSGVSGAAKKAGKVLAVGVVAGAGAATAAIGGFAKSSVEAGRSFDASMSQVAATMGKTTAQMESDVVSVNGFTGNLRDFAQKMGAETSFSATQAADALNYMALAGYDTLKSVEMLPNVLNLAAAGGIDLAYASDMVTDASSALGLKTEQTTAMVDQMARASSKSNTSVAQLGEAMLTIGGTAKNLAGGTVELSTALGILADNGVKGAEGGTHLRNMILSLQNPTEDAAGLLDELGVSVYNLETGQMRSLNDIFGELNGQLSTMSDQQQDAVISQLFNKTDLASARAMLAGTSSDLQSLKVNLRAMAVEGGDAALQAFTLTGGFEEMADSLKEGASAAEVASEMTARFGIEQESALGFAEQMADAVSGEGNRFDVLSAQIKAAWYTSESMEAALSGIGTSSEQLRGRVAALGVTTAEFDDALAESGGDAEAFVNMLAQSADEGTTFDAVLEGMGVSLSNLEGAFDATTGAAQAMADTQLDNLDGALTIFSSALEGVQIALSDAITPALREFVEFGTSRLTEVTAALKSDEFKEFAGNVASGITGAVEGATQAVADFKAGFEEGFDAEAFTGALEGVGAALGRAFGDGSDAPAAKTFGSTLAGGLNIAAEAITAATPVIEGAASAVKFLGDNAGTVLPVVTGVAVAFVAINAASGVAGVVSAVAGALSAIGIGGSAAGAGLAATAGGEAAAGAAASGASVPLFEVGAAVLMIGAGVALAAAGIWLMADAAASLAGAGAGAVAVMVGFAVGLVAIGAAAVVAGPALTAGAVGLLAFGAAVLMVGAGVALASAGLALLAGQLPAIVEFGAPAAANILLMGTGLVVMGSGSMLAGAGLGVLAVGLGAASAALIVATPAMAAAAGGAALLGVSLGVMAGAVLDVGKGAADMGWGLQAAADSMPRIADNAVSAGIGVATLADAMARASGNLTEGSSSMAAAGEGAQALASGVSRARSDAMAAAVAFAAMGAAGSKSLSLIAAGTTGAAAGFARLSASAAASMASAAASAVAAGARIRSAIQIPDKTVRVNVAAGDVKLPHFKMTGEFNAETGDVPTVDVSWWARGGVFTKPAVIGVGEGREPEGVLPLSRLESMLDGEARGDVNVTLNYTADQGASDMVRDLTRMLRLRKMAGAI